MTVPLKTGGHTGAQRSQLAVMCFQALWQNLVSRDPKVQIPPHHHHHPSVWTGSTQESQIWIKEGRGFRDGLFFGMFLLKDWHKHEMSSRTNTGHIQVNMGVCVDQGLYRRVMLRVTQFQSHLSESSVVFALMTTREKQQIMFVTFCFTIWVEQASCYDKMFAFRVSANHRYAQNPAVWWALSQRALVQHAEAWNHWMCPDISSKHSPAMFVTTEPEHKHSAGTQRSST